MLWGGGKCENKRLHETDDIILVKNSLNCVTHSWRSLLHPSIPKNHIKLASTPVTCVIPASCFLSHSPGPKQGWSVFGKHRRVLVGAVLNLSKPSEKEKMSKKEVVTCHGLETDRYFFFVKKFIYWGAWVAQSVKRPTSARSRSRGPGVRAPRQALG